MLVQIIDQYPIQDIIVILFVLFGVLIGACQGLLRKLHRMVILVAVFLIIYFIFSGILSDWIRYNSLADFDFVLSFTYENITFEVYSVEDLFVLFQNLGVDSGLLKMTCEGLCDALSFAILFIVSIFLSTFISWILFDLIFKHIFPQSWVKGGLLKRILGALLGGVEWLAILVVISVALGSITGGLNEVVVPELQDSNSGVAQLITSFGGVDASMLENIASYMQIASGILSPVSDKATIIPNIVGLFKDMNLDLLKLFSGGSYNSSNELVESSLYDGMVTFWNEIRQVASKI